VEEPRAGRVPSSQLNINIFKLKIQLHISMETRGMRRSKFLTSLKTARYVTPLRSISKKLSQVETALPYYYVVRNP
jgi:hypothetical protein